MSSLCRDPFRHLDIWVEIFMITVSFKFNVKIVQLIELDEAFDEILSFDKTSLTQIQKNFISLQTLLLSFKLFRA